MFGLKSSLVEIKTSYNRVLDDFLGNRCTFHKTLWYGTKKRVYTIINIYIFIYVNAIAYTIVYALLIILIFIYRHRRRRSYDSSMT